jgi:hypothetical protein
MGCKIEEFLQNLKTEKLCKRLQKTILGRFCANLAKYDVM